MNGVDMNEAERGMTASATFTCPSCGEHEEIEIPSAGCLAFHECSACHEVARSRNGLCVICADTDKTCAHPCTEETPSEATP